MRIVLILSMLVIFSLLDDSLARTKDEREFVFAKMHKHELKASPLEVHMMMKSYV
jgi:hypothetical protein